MRTAGRIAVWVVATVVVVIAGILLYLSSGWGEGFIRGMAVGTLNDALDADVSIERLETNVFSRLEVEGVDVLPSGDARMFPDAAIHPDGPRPGRSPIGHIRVDRFRVRYGLFTLFFGGLEFDSVIVAGARIEMRSDSLPGPVTAPEDPSDTSASSLVDENGRFVSPVKVGYADLSDVTFLYDDRSIPITITGSGIDITARMDEGPGGEFRIVVDSARMKYFDSPVSVSDLLVSGSINRVVAGGRIIPFACDTLRADVADLKMSGRLEASPDSITGTIAVSGDPKRALAAISKGLDEELGGGRIEAEADFTIDDPLGQAGVAWSLSMPSATASGVTVTDLRCDGRLSSDTLTVRTISFGAYGGTVSGSGWVVLDSAMAHSFTMKVDRVRVSDYWKPRTKAGRLTRLPVTVDAWIDSRGDLSSISDIGAKATLRIATRNSLIAAPVIDYSRRHLSVSSTEGMAGVTAEFDLLPAAPGKRRIREYTGTLDFTVPSIAALAPLEPVIEKERIDGSVGASAIVSGKDSDVGIEATATSDGLTFRGLRVVDSLFATIGYIDGALSIDSSEVSGSGIDVGMLTKTFGAAGTAGSRESADSRESAGGDDKAVSADSTETPAITGVLAYALTARGTIENPTVDLRARIDGPSYGAIAFDRADILASLTDSVVELREAALRKDSSVTSVAGNADLRDLAGRVVVEFRNAAGRNGSFSPDSDSPDSIVAEFRYADSANFSFSASSRHLAVATVRQFVPGLPFDGGQIDFSADVRNRDGVPAAEIPFAASRLTAGKGVIDSIAGTLLFTDGTISVDSLTVGDEGRHYFVSAGVDLQKDADGSYSFDWDCRTNGRITGDTVDLASAATFSADPVEIGGSVDIDLAWDGIVRRPNFNGSLEFRNVRYGPEPKSPWFTDLGGVITLGEGSLRADSIRANVGKVPILVAVDFERGDSTRFVASLDVRRDSVLLLSGTAGFTGDSIDIVFESRDLELAVVQPFVEDLRKLKGLLATRFTVRGPVGDPKVDGMLDIRGASFEPGTSGQALTDGAVRARFTSGKLVLDSAAATFGGGRVFTSGGASIDSGGLKDLDLALKAAGIKLTRKNLYQLNVKSTDLHLESVKERYLLTGVLEFGETRFIRDIEIGDIVQMMAPETDVLEEPKKEEPLDLMTTVKEQVAEPGHTPEFLQKLDFDIELRNADGLWVDNNLAKFRTNHDLRLQGNFDEASLTGRIDVRDRGELIFLDRRFEILNGVIDCSDPRRLNPVINLTATCDVTESSGSSSRPTRYTITLTVSGPLDEFDYALTSKPSLEQADILSLLALGMTQYQLEAGGNKDAVYKDRSEVLASQQISNSVNRFFDNMLGDLLALDHIGIGGNLFDPNQTRFEVTKRWSDRVEIKYSTSITNVDEQILSVEYKINEFLYLEGKSDQMEDSGADLKFRIWFK